MNRPAGVHDSRPRVSPAPSLTSQCWLRLSVQVPCELTEAVANFLLELGSTGIIESEYDATHPPEPLAEVQGFFPPESSGQTLCDALTHYLDELALLFPQLDRPTPHVEEITNQAWQEHRRVHFPPLEIGKRFLLLPPWEPVPVASGRVVIVINPSMAFGTGHHATTRGCLEAIETLCTRFGTPLRALDLGTGSGILAIALAKLGTPEVWATDIDPVALDEAQKNINLNRADPRVRLSNSPVEELPGPFPLIVANLFSTTLVSLAPALGRATEPKGFAILSGIQIDQEEDVRAAYQAPGWHRRARIARDEWVTLVVQRA